MKNLNKNMRLLRMDMGLNQDEWGEMWGLTRQQVSARERDCARWNLAEIAARADKAIDWLVGQNGRRLQSLCKFTENLDEMEGRGD